jgi:hypothetical protein
MTSQVIDLPSPRDEAGALFNPCPEETAMTAITHAPSTRSRSLLRTALWFDALSVAGLGLLLLLLGDALSSLFGIEAGFLRAVGVLLLPFAAFLALTASRERISRVAVGWIVALNAVYVLSSFAVLLLGWLQPTALGSAFVIAQALVGGAVAGVEWIALTREAVQAD